MILHFYTDGACAVQQKAGGWAFYCPELLLKVCGNQKNITNNIMEIQAVISTLQFIYNSHLDCDNIVIYSDSMYVIGTITQNWRINTNQYYWNIVFRYLNLIDIPIVFQHVYGHSGIIENELVDQLAVILSNL